MMNRLFGFAEYSLIVSKIDEHINFALDIHLCGLADYA